MFIGALMKYLLNQDDDRTLYLRAKEVIHNCSKQHHKGNPDYGVLHRSMYSQLKELVAGHHWDGGEEQLKEEVLKRYARSYSRRRNGTGRIGQGAGANADADARRNAGDIARSAASLLDPFASIIRLPSQTRPQLDLPSKQDYSNVRIDTNSNGD